MNDDNVGFVNMDGTRSDGTVATGTMIQGLSDHPNEYQHDVIAEEISKVYSTLAGIENPYVRRFDYKSYEAEDHAIGTFTPNKEADDAGQNWSGNRYVSGLSNSSIKFVSDIETRAANVKHIPYKVSVEKDGIYEIRIGYATYEDTLIGIAVDDGEFTGYTVNSGSWCGGHGAYQSHTALLTKGEHTIYVTGSLGSGWINHDYLNVIGLDYSVGDEAAAWAKNFMDTTGPECEKGVAGETFDTTIWEGLKTSYEGLSENAKFVLVHGEDYAELRERYSIIVVKYNLSNFMESDGVAAQIATQNRGMDSSQLILIATFASILLLVSASCAIVIRHRHRREA